ncbi:MAG: hypothetical protein HC927_01810 [Deltaproteobacteria bacterium]|nr:hypothetical protein [Deltaproteobacteria bacterium]
MLLALWLVPDLAHAGGQVVRVEIAAEQAPTHVCIITGGRGSVEAVSLGQLIGNARLEQRENSWIVARTLPEPKQTGDKDDKPESETVRVALNGLFPDQSDYGHTCSTDDPDRKTLGCTPAFIYEPSDVDRDRAIQCTANRGLATAPARVLVLELESVVEHQLGDVAIEALRLVGHTLEFETEHSLSGPALILSVRGGFYSEATGIEIERAGNRLSIEPRCKWLELKLPPIIFREAGPDQKRRRTPRIHIGPDDATTTTDFVSLDPDDDGGSPAAEARPRNPSEHDTNADNAAAYRNHCISGNPRDTSFRVRVPTHPTPTKKTRVEVVFSHPTDDDDAGFHGIRLLGSYNEPPDELVLAVHALTFAWTEDSCFFQPKAECPSAEILETGIRCETLTPTPGARESRPLSQRLAMQHRQPREPDTNICEYSCPKTTAAADQQMVGIDISKLHVVFTDHDSEQSWTMQLHYIDQVLRGDQDLGKKQAKIEGASLGKGTIDRIDGIEVSYLSVEGQAIRDTLEIDDEQFDKLPLPRFACNNDLTYRYIGDRAYRPARTPVASGEVNLVNPDLLARRVYFVAQLRGGALAPHNLLNWDSDDPLVVPLAELSVGIGIWPLAGKAAKGQGSTHEREPRRPRQSEVAGAMALRAQRRLSTICHAGEAARASERLVATGPPAPLLALWPRLRGALTLAA